MTTTARSYDPNGVQIFVSPYAIKGLKGDTPVTIAPVTSDDEHEISTDGASFVLNRSRDNRYLVTLAMDPGSTGYRQLYEIWVEQNADEAGAIPARAFRLYDPMNGDVIESDVAVIVSRPEIALGAARDAVEFRIVLPNPTIKLGEDL